MRNLMAPVVVVLAALITTGCAADPPAIPGTAVADRSAAARPAPAARPDGALFTDAQRRFAIVPPAGWTPDTTGKQDTAVIFADTKQSTTPTGKFRANLNVIVRPAQADLEGTLVNVRRELATLPGHQPATDEAITLPDGSAAQLLGCTFIEPQNGLPLHIAQVITERDGRTVVATATTLADAWAEYDAVFQTSLRSLTAVA